MPSFSKIAAASRDHFTILAYAVIVTCLPGLCILAFPMGKMKSFDNYSSVSSKASLYINSFSKNTTGFGSLIAALSKPLASSASYGVTTFNPGKLLYQAAKHYEC